MKKLLLGRLVVLMGMSSFLALTGCQTTLTDKLQEQHIDVIAIDQQSSEILKNVTCNFTDSEDNDYVLKKTPSTVTIAEASHQLYLSCEAAEYYQTQIAIAKDLDHWTYKDLTILPGYVINANRFPPPLYPEKIIVFMDRLAPPSPTNADRQFEENQKKEVFFQGRQGQD